jgi:hypothetical protein
VSDGILFGVAIIVVGALSFVRAREQKAFLWLGAANIVIGLLMIVKALTHGFHF